MFLAAKTMPGYAGAAQFEHSGTMRTPPLPCAPNASTALTPVAGLFLAVQGIFLDMTLTHSAASLHFGEGPISALHGCQALRRALRDCAAADLCLAS